MILMIPVLLEEDYLSFSPFLHVIPDRLDDDEIRSQCGALADVRLLLHTKISQKNITLLQNIERTNYFLFLLVSLRLLHSSEYLEWRRIVEKSSYFYFLCIQKVFSSHHKIQIEPLMADGVF